MFQIRGRSHRFPQHFTGEFELSADVIGQRGCYTSRWLKVMTRCVSSIPYSIMSYPGLLCAGCFGRQPPATVVKSILAIGNWLQISGPENRNVASLHWTVTWCRFTLLCMRTKVFRQMLQTDMKRKKSFLLAFIRPGRIQLRTRLGCGKVSEIYFSPDTTWLPQVMCNGKRYIIKSNFSYRWAEILQGAKILPVFREVEGQTLQRTNVWTRFQDG